MLSIVRLKRSILNKVGVLHQGFVCFMENRPPALYKRVSFVKMTQCSQICHHNFKQ